MENTHAQKQAPVEHHGQASNTRGGRLPNTHKNKCMQRKFVVAGNLIGPHVPSCVLIATTKASGKRQLASMCRAAGWQLENSWSGPSQKSKVSGLYTCSVIYLVYVVIYSLSICIYVFNMCLIRLFICLFNYSFIVYAYFVLFQHVQCANISTLGKRTGSTMAGMTSSEGGCTPSSKRKLNRSAWILDPARKCQRKAPRCEICE